ncbi:uncharacterized protein LOC111055388 [Nilaparvata lugens]|uniref:uncharacterized protein LOC111055388 n=1 Tax=Nilaparvata lugens TaxID=108931 RepID=UPI00193DF91A|nr:uncharacterized protein LOC111055388 [Nilaparvata lugens]
MSVSDPLLKEIKGYAQQLLAVEGPITDTNEYVTKFCECLEKIFQQGLSCVNYSPMTFRPSGIWDWLELMADNRMGETYSYQMAVNNVKECTKVKKNIGRARLLIRTCLVKKCLHVPVHNYLMFTDWKHVFSSQSILGDDILCQILYSVLLWVGRLNFALDLNNSRFLDSTWDLPVTNKIELVPCKKMGITVIFVEGKAICFDIQKNSVAAEDDAVEIGDIIDELNGNVITTSSQGTLNNLMRKTAGFPISIYLIKAKWKNNLFPPMVPLLIAAKIDISAIRQKQLTEIDTKSLIKQEMAKSSITFIGHISTGSLGDVKQIAAGINQILSGKGNQIDSLVTFECLDLGVKVTEKADTKVILKHSYMEISSCGCAVDIPYYFAYIASDGLCSQSDSFVCYVFHCNVQTEIDTILNSIGQGFKRTHYVV